MDAQQFAELETKLAALQADNTALKQAGEAERKQMADENKALAERLAAIEVQRQADRFSALIKNNGQRWFGEAAAHLGILGTLAKTFGEGSTEFGAYVAQQQQVATALRQSTAFQELGGDGQGAGEDASAKLDRLARERAKADGGSYADALAKVASEHPNLYQQYSSAAYVRTKGAE